MKNLEKLVDDISKIEKLVDEISKATSMEEVREIEERHGYRDLVRSVTKAHDAKYKEIKERERLERRENMLKDRKSKLQDNLFEDVYYVGVPQGDFTRNKVVKLTAIKRKYCHVLMGDETWKVPIMEIDTQPTTARALKFTENGVKAV